MASEARLSQAAGSRRWKFAVGFSSGPPGHSKAALQTVGELPGILDAVNALAETHADAIVWACTSGSFIRGYSKAREQGRRLQDAAGIPVTTATLALISSARRLGVQRMGVLSPYPEEISGLFRSCMEDAGFEVVALRSLNSPGATESSRLVLENECAAFADLECDAVVIPDTAANSLSVIGRLEASASKPVLTVNQACLFEVAMLAGEGQNLAELPAFHRFRGCVNGSA